MILLSHILCFMVYTFCVADVTRLVMNNFILKRDSIFEIIRYCFEILVIIVYFIYYIIKLCM